MALYKCITDIDNPNYLWLVGVKLASLNPFKIEKAVSNISGSPQLQIEGGLGYIQPMFRVLVLQMGK